MDHNLNVNRKQATYRKKNAEGHYVPKYRVRYSKATKRFTALKVKVDKSYNFMRRIAEASYFRAVHSERRNKTDADSRKRDFCVAAEERPSRVETVENTTKYSRVK